MTDKEIIKALECCANNPNDCVCYENECPLFGQKCIDILSKNALDLINHQQADIETLKINCLSMARTMPNMAKAERAEAIKEFAKMLKKDWVANRYNCPDLDVLDWIDHFVKEMVGAENAK